MTIWTSNETHLQLFNDIASEYQASHPNVTELTFDPLSYDDYTTTLTTQIAGGNGPDLAWILESSAPDFVSSGALVALNDALSETEGYDLDDLTPSATTLWYSGDQLYAYPFSTSPFGVFVNTDLITRSGGQSPADLIAAGTWNWDNLATLWTGWGAEAWSADGKTCGFNQQPMVDAMAFLHQGIFTANGFPGPGTTADFFAGEAGMTITQISRASLLEDGAFGWDLVPLPAGPEGGYSVIGQAGLGVLKQGEHPAVAADFLAWFTNPTNSARLAQYFPPPRTSLLTAETLAQTNPLLTAEQLQNVVIDGITTGVVKPSHTGQAEIAQTVRSALDSLWTRDADVQSVLDSVCAAVQPLLDE